MSRCHSLNRPTFIMGSSGSCLYKEYQLKIGILSIVKSIRIEWHRRYNAQWQQWATRPMHTNFIIDVKSVLSTPDMEFSASWDGSNALTMADKPKQASASTPSRHLWLLASCMDNLGTCDFPNKSKKCQKRFLPTLTLTLKLKPGGRNGQFTIKKGWKGYHPKWFLVLGILQLM